MVPEQLVTQEFRGKMLLAQFTSKLVLQVYSLKFSLYNHGSLCALHCDWFVLHGAGNKLCYGHVQDPFPQSRIGSGHVRLSCQAGALLCKFSIAYEY